MINTLLILESVDAMLNYIIIFVVDFCSFGNVVNNEYLYLDILRAIPNFFLFWTKFYGTFLSYYSIVSLLCVKPLCKALLYGP